MSDKHTTRATITIEMKTETSPYTDMELMRAIVKLLLDIKSVITEEVDLGSFLSYEEDFSSSIKLEVVS